MDNFFIPEFVINNASKSHVKDPKAAKPNLNLEISSPVLVRNATPAKQKLTTKKQTSSESEPQLFA